MLTASLVHSIKEEAALQNKKVFVDSKSQNLPRYSGVYLIKPNKGEAEALAGEVFMEDYANLENVGRRMSEMLGLNLIITLGKDGMALFSGSTFLHRKTESLQVFDVSGAGDTVLAVIATAVASGADLESAMDLSNNAAGYVVSRLGTSVCSSEVLIERISGLE